MMRDVCELDRDRQSDSDRQTQCADETIKTYRYTGAHKYHQNKQCARILVARKKERERARERKTTTRRTSARMCHLYFKPSHRVSAS